MNSTSIVLIATCILVGGLWFLAVQKASRLAGHSKNLKWKALLLFLAVACFDLFLGASGIIQDFTRMPPPFAFFFISLFALAFWLAFSKFGTLIADHISLKSLVAFHSFRAFAELVIFLGNRDGIAPVQMSLEGLNFDILIAISALLVSYFVSESSRRIFLIWNWAGVVSLLNIAVIAILSMPTPLRYFQSEPSNIWVTHAPYILLPGILVVSALAGHLIVFRKLKRS